MPDLTKMGMSFQELKKEAAERHIIKVKEIENSLPPEVSSAFLKAWKDFVNNCFTNAPDKTWPDNDDDELFTKHLSIFMKIISKGRRKGERETHRFRF